MCGFGVAGGGSTGAAVREAFERARAGLGDRRPDLALVFATVGCPLQDVAAEAAPLVRGAVLSITGAGTLTEEGGVEGVGIFLIAWGAARHVIEPPVPLAEGLDVVARRLTASYAGLAGPAGADGLHAGLTLLFADGLSPALENLVTRMRKTLPMEHDIVGGGAGDNGSLVRSYVGAGGLVAATGATAVHVASRSRWGIGVGQGATPLGEPMAVTRSEANVVHELDGRSTLEVYRELAAREGAAVHDDAHLRRFLVEYQLGIRLFDDVSRIRVGFEPRADGSVAFAGEVPEGATVSFVRGTTEGYVEGARQAARSAKKALGEQQAAGVLIISCITRAMVMGERTGEEVVAVREVFGDVPVGGFLSYGEVARVPGKLDGFHNNAIVAIAIPR